MLTDAGFVGDEQIQKALDILLQTERTTIDLIDLDGRSVPAREPEQNHTRTINKSNRTSTCPLIPTELTLAQMEMLLELEWAHRAMIQSYVIALIDNAAAGGFTNLTTLTLANIPSSHLHIFCRDDLWRGIPRLSNVILGVLAD